MMWNQCSGLFKRLPTRKNHDELSECSGFNVPCPIVFVCFITCSLTIENVLLKKKLPELKAMVLVVNC